MSNIIAAAEITNDNTSGIMVSENSKFSKNMSGTRD
jgi:hypothetical protein